MPLKKIWSAIKTIVYTERWIIQLELIEKSALMVGLGFWWLIIIAFAFGGGLFAGIWAAMWIGEYVHDLKTGFLSVAAFFFFIMLIILVWRKRILDMITNQAIKTLQIKINDENDSITG